MRVSESGRGFLSWVGYIFVCLFVGCVMCEVWWFADVECGAGRLSSAQLSGQDFSAGNFVRSGEGKIEVIKRKRNFVSFLFFFPLRGLRVG